MPRRRLTPEERLAYQREWKRRNPDKMKQRRKKWYDARKDDPEWREHWNQRAKAYRATERAKAVRAAYLAAEDPAVRRERARRYRQEYRQGYRAHSKLRSAIKAGRIKRPDQCEQCGAGGAIEGAHHDYTKPLDVRWLCRPCHRVWDKAIPKLVEKVTEKLK
jgi:hypothetical protein